MSTAVRSSAESSAQLNQVRRRRATTLLAAVVAALAGWVVAGPLIGIPLRVRFGSGGPAIPVTVLAAGLISLLVGLIAWGLLASLERSTAKARPVWTIVASVVLLVSLAGPLGGVQPATVIALMCLHALVGAVLIVGFRRSTDR